MSIIRMSLVLTCITLIAACGDTSDDVEAGGTGTLDSTDGTTAVDATDETSSVDLVDSTDTADSTDMTDSTDSTDSTDTADGTDTAEATDATDSTDMADGMDSTDSTDTADGMDSTDSMDTADGIDSTDGSDASGPAAAIESLLAVTIDSETLEATLDAPVTIDGAYVSYVKPVVESAGTSDTAGFFLQVSETGPAIFVQSMACTDEGECAAAHSYAVGDKVAIEVSTVADLVGMNTVSEYTEISVETGVLPFAAQDVSAATDLVTNLDGFAAKLVSATFTVDGDFGFAGMGYEAASISTAGVTQNENLLLRAPKDLLDAIPLVPACTLSVSGVMWRYFNEAQISVFDSSEISDIDCPGPTVVSAVAISATAVAVTFDQTLDETSVLADGSQFTFDNGVTASAAIVSGDGDTVTVTTTEQPDAVLSVTVDSSIAGLLGGAISSVANSTTFKGFVVKAVLAISEINAGISGGCDLIEFYVLSAGTLDGLSVFERTTNIKTFTDTMVEEGDVIVLHIDSGDTNCVVAGATDEVTGPGENTAASDYASAWDAYSDDTGLVATDNVIRVETPFGNIQDAVFLTDVSEPSDDQNSASGTEAAAALVVEAAQWTVVEGDPPMSYVDADFHAHAIPGLGSTDNNVAGDSLQRLNSTDDTDTKADWFLAPSTFGVQNGD